MSANNQKEKKLVSEITAMDEDFAKWYTDIVKKADLIDYSSVKGCMIIRPYGYAIWENIQKCLDRRFKETGVKNVSLPLICLYTVKGKNSGSVCRKEAA